MLIEETKTIQLFTKPVNYHVVLIGVGGTGGYVVRQLIRMMYSYQSIGKSRFHLTLCDGDMVEGKNLLRQDFIESDVNKKKVDVLAHRFSHAYGIPISKRDTYVEDLESLEALCKEPNSFADDYKAKTKLIVVGAVDNNATRQLLHRFFEKRKDLIYIDAGNDGVMQPDRPYTELSVEEREQIDQSGYSGQVVMGIKTGGKVILPPVCDLFPDMAADKETFFPSQSCGMEVVNNPQRRMTNEVSAMVVTSYLNNLFAENRVVSHMTTFNARTMKITPRLFNKDYVEYLNDEFDSGLLWEDEVSEVEDDEDVEEVENEGFEYEDEDFGDDDDYDDKDEDDLFDEDE